MPSARARAQRLALSDLNDDDDFDDGVLKNGRSIKVPMTLVDEAMHSEMRRHFADHPSQVVTDAFGNPIIGGGQPGYRFLRSPQLDRVRSETEALREQRAQIAQDAWRGDGGSLLPPPSPAAAAPTRDSLEQLRDAETARRRDAWRGPAPEAPARPQRHGVERRDDLARHRSPSETATRSSAFPDGFIPDMRIEADNGWELRRQAALSAWQRA